MRSDEACFREGDIYRKLKVSQGHKRNRSVYLVLKSLGWKANDDEAVDGGDGEDIPRTRSS